MIIWINEAKDNPKRKNNLENKYVKILIISVVLMKTSKENITAAISSSVRS
jgi:hypothetical protein